MVKDPSENVENTGEMGSISRSGRPQEEEMVSTPSILLGKPMDRGSCWATVHGITKIRTQLSTHTQFCLKVRTGKEKGKG